jgi:hypothetical protein
VGRVTADIPTTGDFSHGKLVFALAAIATLAFAAPVYASPDCSNCIIVATPDCSGCVVADSGGCSSCIVADGNCTGCVVADCAGCVIADNGCNGCVVADGGGCTNCVVADGCGNSGCVIAEGSVGCGGCVVADGGGKGGNVTGFAGGASCTAEDNKGHCVESASYQCAPYSEACRLPRKPRRGKVADCSTC